MPSPGAWWIFIGSAAPSGESMNEVLHPALVIIFEFFHSLLLSSDFWRSCASLCWYFHLQFRSGNNQLAECSIPGWWHCRICYTRNTAAVFCQFSSSSQCLWYINYVWLASLYSKKKKTRKCQEHWQHASLQWEKYCRVMLNLKILPA